MDFMKRVLVLMFLRISFVSYAQKSDLGNWLIYFGNVKLNSKFNWHNEVQYRNYNAVGDLEQLLLRTGVGVNLTENNNNLLLGYGFILSQNYVGNSDEKVDVNEHRIYQQFITKQRIGRVGLQHRYRFEQRFVADDFKMRFRYFLGFNLPLNKQEVTDGTFYLSSYNEIFLNSKDNVFDRNRLYGGLGFRLNSTLKMEVGYMNQFFGGRNRDQMNFMAFVSL